jgi:hypothetical protein
MKSFRLSYLSLILTGSRDQFTKNKKEGRRNNVKYTVEILIWGTVWLEASLVFSHWW